MVDLRTQIETYALLLDVWEDLPTPAQDYIKILHERLKECHAREEIADEKLLVPKHLLDK